MKKRIGLLGLILVGGALPLGGILASSAVGTPETGNTAFTCITGAGEDNTDAHCDPGSFGESGHVAIAEGESTGLALTKLANFLIHFRAGLVSVTIESTGIECVGCMVQDQTDSGVMDVTGQGGKLRLTGATINVSGCSITGGEIVTEPLKLTTQSPTRLELAPETPPTFVVVHLSPPTCVLGTSITITGHANGAMNGATLTFSTGAGELSVGSQTAFLTGQATVTAGVAGGTYHPIALTAA